MERGNNQKRIIRTNMRQYACHCPRSAFIVSEVTAGIPGLPAWRPMDLIIERTKGELIGEAVLKCMKPYADQVDVALNSREVHTAYVGAIATRRARTKMRGAQAVFACRSMVGQAYQDGCFFCG